MRIIIDSQGGEELHGPNSQPVSVVVQDVDAGSAPSPTQEVEASMASSNGSTSGGSTMNGINAGPPPQWLLDAIAQTASPAKTSQNVASDQDAGSAPVL